MLHNTLTILDSTIDLDLSQGTEIPHFNFSDAGSVSAWAVEAIEYLYRRGLINTDKDNNINPINPVTVDSANFHAQTTLEHYNDLKTLNDSEKDSPLGSISKNMQITMADKTKKLIQELHIGDKIMSENGMLLKVQDIFTSHDVTIISINFGDGGYIAVSDSKPVATNQGVMRARDLHLGIKLQHESGAEVEILLINRTEYNDTSYELLLDARYDGSGYFYIANGAYVGDFNMERHMRDNSRNPS